MGERFERVQSKNCISIRMSNHFAAACYLYLVAEDKQWSLELNLSTCVFISLSLPLH